MAVSFRRALEHSAREQAFSPERHQTLGVEVLRMKCPEAHPAPNNQIQVSPALQHPLRHCRASRHPPTIVRFRDQMTAGAEARNIAWQTRFLEPPIDPPRRSASDVLQSTRQQCPLGQTVWQAWLPRRFAPFFSKSPSSASEVIYRSGGAVAESMQRTVPVPQRWGVDRPRRFGCRLAQPGLRGT